MKVILIIKGFIYDEVIALHTNRRDFAPRAKIKIQDLFLRSKVLHRIIAHNILPKKWHYDKVTFIDMCLIECMIRVYPINLSYIMIRNIIMTHD
jgi:hypothetical protein